MEAKEESHLVLLRDRRDEDQGEEQADNHVRRREDKEHGVRYAPFAQLPALVRLRPLLLVYVSPVSPLLEDEVDTSREDRSIECHGELADALGPPAWRWGHTAVGSHGC